MSHMITNEQKLNDIIFADRNKEYGAYVLRSEYGHTVFKSLSMMILGVGTIASVALYINKKNQPPEDLAGQVVIADSIYVVKFNTEEKKPEEQQTEENVEKPKSKEKPDIATVTSTLIDSTFNATQTSTIAVAVNTGTSTSEDNPIPTSGGGKGPVGPNAGPDTSLVAEPYGVDTAPEFEGGYAALSRFVARNLKYPESAYDMGKEGIVYVKFVVDENGKVGRLTLQNNAGYGMDEEALRVVGMIPKFKSPAKVKGVAVKSYYQLPIRFRFR